MTNIVVKRSKDHVKPRFVNFLVCFSSITVRMQWMVNTKWPGLLSKSPTRIFEARPRDFPVLAPPHPGSFTIKKNTHPQLWTPPPQWTPRLKGRNRTNDLWFVIWKLRRKSYLKVCHERTVTFLCSALFSAAQNLSQVKLQTCSSKNYILNCAYVMAVMLFQRILPIIYQKHDV